MLKHPDIAVIFRVLADPTRRQIVERLGRGPASVSDLARPFDSSLAAIVQHLQALEEAGLVASEKTGRVRTCRLAPGWLDILSGWAADRRHPMEHRLDRLGAMLAEDTDSENQTKKGKTP